MNDFSVSDLAAVTRDNDGFNGSNGLWWIVILFLLLGWGGRGYGYGNQGGAGDASGNVLYPWMNQAQGQWQGFADVQQGLCGGFANAETAATARQMASMQQGFGLSQQFSQCCCDNRLAMANQTATILAENCADRAAISDGVRDIIASQTAGTQRILDQLCQDKIDAKNEEIANLRQQINMMNLAASQNLQTAQILADNASQTSALEQYLAPVPRPAYVVQNPNCCSTWNNGCGCN